MGWSSDFRPIDNLPHLHWDETEFRDLLQLASVFLMIFASVMIISNSSTCWADSTSVTYGVLL